MDETPNDSGGSPVSALDEPVAVNGEPAGSRWGESGIRRMSAGEVKAQLRRPAVWGLLVLVAVVIVVQVWLLFL